MIEKTFTGFDEIPFPCLNDRTRRLFPTDKGTQLHALRADGMLCLL